MDRFCGGSALTLTCLWGMAITTSDQDIEQILLAAYRTEQNRSFITHNTRQVQNHNQVLSNHSSSILRKKVTVHQKLVPVINHEIIARVPNAKPEDPIPSSSVYTANTAPIFSTTTLPIVILCCTLPTQARFSFSKRSRPTTGKLQKQNRILRGQHRGNLLRLVRWQAC